MKDLTELSQEMYEKDVWPEYFTRIVIIPIEKKVNAMECEDYRTISLIYHASKIMLKVLTRRIEVKAKISLVVISLDLGRGCGTRDAIDVMRVVCERSLKHWNDVYVCFVDFEKRHLIE